MVVVVVVIVAVFVVAVGVDCVLCISVLRMKVLCPVPAEKPRQLSMSREWF